MPTYRYEISSDFTFLEDFLLDIKNHFDTCETSIHKARNELKSLHVKNEKLVIKSFKIPKGIQKIVYSFSKPSKAKTSYHNALKLKECGIKTPEPVGYIEFYENGFLKESYFVTKEWNYDFTIREPLLDFDFENKEEIFKAFAKFVNALHVKNITHKDLSPGNILIRKKDLQMCIVDINRMKFSPLSISQKANNFSKLWAEDEDLKTIIKHYTNFAKVSQNEILPLALSASQKHKAKTNLKKRLRGKKVG